MKIYRFTIKDHAGDNYHRLKFVFVEAHDLLVATVVLESQRIYAAGSVVAVEQVDGAILHAREEHREIANIARWEPHQRNTERERARLAAERIDADAPIATEEPA